MKSRRKIPGQREVSYEHEPRLHVPLTQGFGCVQSLSAQQELHPAPQTPGGQSVRKMSTSATGGVADKLIDFTLTLSALLVAAKFGRAYSCPASSLATRNDFAQVLCV